MQRRRSRLPPFVADAVRLAKRRGAGAGSERRRVESWGPRRCDCLVPVWRHIQLERRSYVQRLASSCLLSSSPGSPSRGEAGGRRFLFGLVAQGRKRSHDQSIRAPQHSRSLRQAVLAALWWRGESCRDGGAGQPKLALYTLRTCACGPSWRKSIASTHSERLSAKILRCKSLTASRCSYSSFCRQVAKPVRPFDDRLLFLNSRSG